MAAVVEDAYARRAAEYVARLGSMASVHPSDEHLVSTWASSIGGPLLDAGCGPGHWTSHLTRRGHTVRGVDKVPAFIEHARRTHPDVPFTIGDLDALAEPAASFAGVLAWYSLIHHDPATIDRPLREFARVLRPGGGLLVGFFVGPRVESFEHAVVTAHRWSPDAFARQLDATGFEVVETHTRTGPDAGPRPHGAILARLRSPERSVRAAAGPDQLCR